MTTIATLKAACLFALTLALTSSLAATKKDVDEAMSRDGLQKISVKGSISPMPAGRVARRLQARQARSGRGRVRQVVGSDSDRQPNQAWRRGAREDQGGRRQARRGGVRQGAAERRCVPDHERIRARRPARQGQRPQRLHQRAQRNQRRALENVCVIGRPDDVAGRASDAASGQMLARVADRREGTAWGACSAPTASRRRRGADVAAAWAQILRKALDKARAIGRDELFGQPADRLEHLGARLVLAEVGRASRSSALARVSGSSCAVM